MKADARAVATEALVKLDASRSGERWLRQTGQPRLAQRRDRALAKRIYQLVARRRLLLDQRISAFSKRPLDAMQPQLRNRLRVATAELAAFEKVPDRAVVHSCVAGVKAELGKGPAGFANAILRSMLRKGVKPLPPAGVPDLPPWIVGALLDVWGGSLRERVTALMREAPLCLRRRPGTLSAEESEALQAFGHNPWPGRDDLLLAPGGTHPSEVPGFGRGLWTVQDAGAVLSAELLEPEPGNIILDLCAAPGGKSLFFADRAGSTGRVIAVDRSIERMGSFPEPGPLSAPIDCIEVDLSEPEALDLVAEAAAGRTINRIFLDAPCTALGTLRRHPELMWLRRPEDPTALAKRQLALLRAAAQLLAPGGRLVYTVCSPLRSETTRVLKGFLKDTASWDLVIPALEPGAPVGIRDDDLVETLPERAPCDAFASAVLRRLS